MRIGVIGTGNMGGMLARAFAKKRDFHVYAYNRTLAKLATLAQEVPEIAVCDSAEEVIRSTDVVFLCTKSSDGRALVTRFCHLFRPTQLLVTTISGVPLAEWVQHTHGPVVKLIPSLTQRVNAGLVLTTYGHRCTAEHVAAIDHLFAGIAAQLRIDETQVRTSSDITSCGPAFMSYLFMRWATAASTVGTINVSQAENMLRETVIGLAALLQSGMRFEDVVAQIAVPGGVTEVGLQAMHEGAYRLFAELHRHTHSTSEKPRTAHHPEHALETLDEPYIMGHQLETIVDKH